MISSTMASPPPTPRFFFSSRRRHTRYWRDWSSDVCSSDLRYSANVTGRYEGSNRLGKARTARWLPTWNVSGAWNAHEEPWFNSAFKNVLTHATLREIGRASCRERV